MTTKKRPIEDPSRLVAFTDAVASLDWAPSSYLPSAEVLFRRLSELTQAEVQYYYDRRLTSRTLSKVCRLLAWLLGTTGILIPLIQPVLGANAPPNLLSWGYIAFGAGGAVMIFDTVFAGTEAHQRYTATQLELEKVYTVFALEWQAQVLKLTTSRSPDSALELVNRAVAFATEMHRVMGAETSAWQVTVNKALAELKGTIDNGKPGAQAQTTAA